MSDLRLQSTALILACPARSAAAATRCHGAAHGRAPRRCDELSEDRTGPGRRSRARRRCRKVEVPYWSPGGSGRSDYLTLEICTRTSPGAMRVIPASGDAPACTRSMYWPEPSPARSTKAVTSSGSNPVERIPATTKADVDRGGHRLRRKVRGEITEVDGPSTNRPLERRRHNLNGHGRWTRVLQPERRIEQADGDGFDHPVARTRDRDRLGQRFSHLLDRALRPDDLDACWVGRRLADHVPGRRPAIHVGDYRHLPRC